MKDDLNSFFELLHLQSGINQIFDVLKELGESPSHPSITPPYDIYENENAVVIVVDIPGVKIHSLKIEAKSGQIIISGEKKRRNHKGIKACILLECEVGHFSRIIPVDLPANTHKATSVYSKGALTITIPKVENRRGSIVSLPVTVS